MRKYFIYEIEANEKPIFSYGEWEELSNYTTNLKPGQSQGVAAYGEVKDGRYIELYKE